MEEKDILPDLTNDLSKPLPSKKRTVEQAFEDKVEDEEAVKPVSPATKQAILRLASALTKTDPKKYLPIINKIKDMTEQEALMFLECLEASHVDETYGALTARVVSCISDIVIHPSDVETKEEMVNDELLNRLTSRQVASVLEKAGGAALLFLILFYGASSWSRVHFINQLPFFNAAPVQNDSDSAESVGEVDPDGKANDPPVDKTI